MANLRVCARVSSVAGVDKSGHASNAEGCARVNVGENERVDWHRRTQLLQNLGLLLLLLVVVGRYLLKSLNKV